MNGDKRMRVIAGIVVLVLVVGGGVWLSRKKKTETLEPEIVLEQSKMIEEQLQLPLSEFEKQEIEDVFAREGVEMTALQDVAEGQATGTAWRHFDGEKFYHKIQVVDLPALEKGFFYEGWLVSDEGFFSTGRVPVVNGEGSLYFKTDEDRLEFQGVVVTLEPEDGDEAPAEHVLEGNF